MVRNHKTAKRAGTMFAAGTLAVLATALLAAPAIADSDDIDVTKTADVTSAAAGETVTYSVEVRGSDLIDLNDPGATEDTNVLISDDLPDHMSFVPGSASVTFSEVSPGVALHLAPGGSYASGSGWTGPWVETNDDGTAGGGDIRGNLLTISARNPSGDLPSIARSVDPAGTVRSVAFSFASADFFTGANDQVIAEMSLDGGATWPYSETITGGEGAELHSITAEGVAADTITVRFRVLTTGTWGITQALLFSAISVAYAYDTSTTTTPLVDGDILDLDGNIAAGYWDLSYAETVILTYQATVNELITDTTELVTNTATITSDDDIVGEIATYDLALNRSPDFDIVVTNNGPIHIGDPLIVTAKVSHSDESDGFPMCGANFQSNTPPNFNFTYVSGDDGDDCLEYGEEWVFTRTFTDRSVLAGLFSLELGLFGAGPSTSPDGISVFSETDFTVVLADSGPPAASANLAISASLILLGAGFMVYSRRKLA